MKSKSKTPLSWREMQLRSVRSRWSKFTKKERSQAMRALRRNALHKAKRLNTYELDDWMPAGHGPPL
jgi:hypothetical protein